MFLETLLVLKGPALVNLLLLYYHLSLSILATTLLLENCTTNPALKRSQLARPEWSVHPSEPESLGQSSRKVERSWHYPGWLFRLCLTRQILHYQGWSQTPCLAPTPSPPQKPAGWCPWLMSFLWIFFFQLLFVVIIYKIINKIINHHWAKISLTVTPSTFSKLNILFSAFIFHSDSHDKFLSHCNEWLQNLSRPTTIPQNWRRQRFLIPTHLPLSSSSGWWWGRCFYFSLLGAEYLERWVSRIVADI